MKKYCTECGQPTEYTSSLPKFCQGCGISFNLLVREKAKASKVIKAKKSAEPEDKEDEDEDEDEGDELVAHIPNLSHLEVEIETSKVKGTPLKDIMGTAGDGFEREIPQEQSKEQFLQQFKKEAGSLRSRGSSE